MPTESDVRRICLAMPSVTERLSWGRPAWFARSLMARMWDDDVLTVKTRERDVLAAAEPETYYWTDHHERSPLLLLVRLPRVPDEELGELLEESFAIAGGVPDVDRGGAAGPPRPARPLSPRLQAVVDALPLRTGLRVIEVGGAPGAAARAVADRVGPTGHVLVLDRSTKGIELTERLCAEQIRAGLVSVRCSPVEEAMLAPGEAPYDLAFGCRVGVLDGRHPARQAEALARLRAMLTPAGRIFVDTGSPLVEVSRRP